MRGSINHIRGLAEAKALNFMAVARELREELAHAANAHFSNHLGGTMSGVFVRLPFTRLSAWLEWRNVNCGIGIERAGGNLQVWFGRLDLVFSIEPLPVPAEIAK